MATKAELEAELASLKKQLAEREALSTSQTAAENVETAVDEIGGPTGDDLDEAFAALREGDLGALAQQLKDEIKGLPLNSPVLTTIVAFLLGYMLGRAR